MIRFTFDPVFIRLGALEIGWHGLFTALAVVAGVWLGSRRATARGIPSEPLGSIATWIIAGGIVGARLFHVLDHLSYFSHHPLEIIAVWQGGIAVYGSFIGGSITGMIAARRHGVPIWTLFDAVAPVVLIGQMIGRLGCLSNGDAWGEPTGGSWGIVYTHPDTLMPSGLIGVATHPYPLYEIAATLLLLGLMRWGGRFLRAPGNTFLATAAGYAVIRFSLTFFRQEPVLLWGLQEAQVIAIGTAVLTAVIFAVNRRRTARMDGLGRHAG